MSAAQGGLRALTRDTTTFKDGLKRPSRERPEDAPIKKRVMAAMNLKRRHPEAVPNSLEGMPRALKIKKECEEEVAGTGMEAGRRWCEEGDDRKQLLTPTGGGALDLSPGLKHTLAQFTLSSQSSLGGPAAFSARSTQDVLAPLPSPPVMGGGPLLVPCDSSTELTHSLLEGESISCFMVGGEKRLCLPQVLNSVLREFSLQQINAVCDELYVYCSRCDAEQLHILKVLGILPFNAPSCGLITLTDAQRLCNALLRPGTALPLPQDPGGGKLREGGASFRVEHQCLGKCQGVFLAQLYTRPDAPCIQCVQCQLLFTPPRFVMHSHRSPDKRTCHWGFDSARWPRYLHLGRKHLGTPQEAELKQLLEEVKERFRCPQKSAPLDKKEEGLERPLKRGSDLCSQNEKLCDGDPERKAKPSPALAFSPRPYPDIKEESGHNAAVFHPSYLLYMCDKMGVPDLSPPLSAGKEEAGRSAEVLGAMLRQHYSGARKRILTQGQEDTAVMSPSASDLNITCDTVGSVVKPPPLAVTMGTGAAENGPALSEEDKDRMVLELLQMYCRQQEVLRSTLQKQRQLEMELEDLHRRQATDQRELCEDLEEVCTERDQTPEASAEHAQTQAKERTEHAQKLAEERTEHAQTQGDEHTEHAQTQGEERTEHAQTQGKERTEHAQTQDEECTDHAQTKGENNTDHAQTKGENNTDHAQTKGEDNTEHAQRQDESAMVHKLEAPRQKTCMCTPSAEQHQEAQYTAQLLELRRRLDRAEEDREELQEELHREREAREKLELMISQLRQQVSRSGSPRDPPASPQTAADPEPEPDPEAEQP